MRKDYKYTIHHKLMRNELPLGFVWTNEDGSGWVLGMGGTIGFDNWKEKEEIVNEIASLPPPHHHSHYSQT